MLKIKIREEPIGNGFGTGAQTRWKTKIERQEEAYRRGTASASVGINPKASQEVTRSELTRCDIS
jgi:hypothetical protein